MTNQTSSCQHTGIQTLMDDLKSMPLPDSHKRWKKTISLEITGHENLSYVWYIRDGQWRIEEGRLHQPDLIIQGTEIEFVKTFSVYDSNMSGIWVQFIKPNSNRGWPLGDAHMIGKLIGRIKQKMNKDSNELLAEATQRRENVVAFPAEKPVYLDQGSIPPEKDPQQKKVQAEPSMTPRLQTLLKVMSGILIFFFLFTLMVASIAFVLFFMVFQSPDPSAINVKAVLALALASVLAFSSLMVINQARKIKRHEQDGQAVPPKTKALVRTLLQVIFVVFMGLPAIAGVGFLLMSFMKGAPTSLEAGDSSSGVQGVYNGIPFFISDSVMGLAGQMCILILVPMGLIWLIIMLITRVLPVIKKDF